MKKIEALDKYQFVFYSYDKDNVVTVTMKLSTKKVTAKRAGELLLESKIKYFTKKDKYVYSVLKNGQEINPKSLR